MKLFVSRLHYKSEPNIYEKVVLNILKIFGYPYTLITELRNKAYEKKILRSYRSKSYVISIGNITTGGVGKTPFVLECAKYYLSKNKRVAVISRGYGSKLNINGVNIISEGNGALFPARVGGDEPVWLSNNCKGLIVATCKSRIKAEKYLSEHYNPDIIILDDGFQHRKMKRDLDILLADSVKKFGNGYVLPAGPLREKLTNVKRASKIVVVNKNPETKEALKYCDELKHTFEKDIYLCNIVPDISYNIITGQQLEKGKRIIAFSAIGQPDSFYEFLKDDFKLVAVMEFEDHHIYNIEDVSKIIQYAQEENIDCVVTTEKDAVKMKEIIKDVEMPVKFYALKLKSYADIKEICGG